MRFYIPCFSMVALLLLGYFVLFHCFWMLYSHPEQGIGQSLASPQASATNDTSGLMTSEGTTTTVVSTAIVPPALSDGPLSTKKAVGKSPDLSQSTRSTNRSEHQGGIGGAFLRGKMSWDAFADMPLPGLHQFTAALPRNADDDPLLLSKAIDAFDPVMCSERVSQDLKRPRLTTAEFDWCIWALSPEGGKVVVGQSWGRLSNKADHMRFDRNNCNAVKSGKNPSCDDSWGDKHVRDWISNRMHSLQCDVHRKSKVNCHLNDNSDKFCSIINAQISFQQYTKVSRGSYTTPSKQFERNFLSADCSSSPAVQSQVPFRHLFSTTAIASEHCDLVYNGTLLLFSHDDIR